MDMLEAKRKLQELWAPTVESAMGCQMQIDDAQTKEHPWGWVFCFVPRQPEQCSRPHKQCAYAFHRQSGDSIPVGAKGLEDAVRHLQPQ